MKITNDLRDDEPAVPLARRAFRFALYILRKKLIGFPVPDMPSFDPESTPFFVEQLQRCTAYLEYGSGGSSFLAAKLGKQITSVDSDRSYLRSVERKIRAAGRGRPDDRFIYCDIGLTRGWGKPLFLSPNLNRQARWRRYSSAPWRSGTSRPDLVLVDGRFRVACALISIKHLQMGNDWTVLVDDYAGRAYYREIERFAVLQRMVGRMAVFTRMDGLSAPDLDAAIARFALDWR